MVGLESFLENSNQDVDGDSDPYLCVHSVLGSSVECFDSKMLFDPFEEEFDLPTTLVELCNGKRREKKIVGEKDE